MTQFSIPIQSPGIFFGELGNVPSDWLKEQQNLTIMLKDGYTFFKANRAIFADRFSDVSKTTIILINNPDTRFIEAIADKDYNKTPGSQVNDYLQTILLLQGIAAELRADMRECNATFAGFEDVATENIFLGDQTFFKKFYPTQSYRGPLEGCVVDAAQSDAALFLFERATKTCQALLQGQVRATDDAPVRKPAIDLWPYKVPAEYRQNDLRDVSANHPKALNYPSP